MLQKLTIRLYIVHLAKIPFLYLIYEKGIFTYWHQKQILLSLFGNISSNDQTTSIGYQCNSITLIQSYQDYTWLIFPKFANSNKGEKGALHIRMHPLKHYFFDLNICFFTHVQRLAVCPIQNKMNKKPILPCTAPM